MFQALDLFYQFLAYTIFLVALSVFPSARNSSPSFYLPSSPGKTKFIFEIMAKYHSPDLWLFMLRAHFMALLEVLFWFVLNVFCVCLMSCLPHRTVSSMRWQTGLILYPQCLAYSTHKTNIWMNEWACDKWENITEHIVYWESIQYMVGMVLMTLSHKNQINLFFSCQL